MDDKRPPRAHPAMWEATIFSSEAHPDHLARRAWGPTFPTILARGAAESIIHFHLLLCREDIALVTGFWASLAETGKVGSR